MYLASVGRHDEAGAIVRRLVRATGADVQEWRRAEVEAPAATPGTWRGKLAAVTGQIADLWRWSTPLTLVAWSLFVSVLLLYYAALTWMPKILQTQGLADEAAFIVTGQMTAVGIVGVIVSAVLVEVIGRKWQLGLSAITAAAALVGFSWVLESSGAELSGTAQTLILVFGFLIQIAIPTLYTYVSELYPTALRASGFGWASSASRVATGIAPLVFGSFLWPVLGLTWTFALTGGLVVLAVILMAVLAHDTTGRELD